MECYACSREATQECTRCGNPYCPEHGDNLCDACLSLTASHPSSTTFRGSILALLVGGILAIWLLVRPPDLPGQSSSNLQPLPTQQEFNTPLPRSSPTVLPSPTAIPSPSPTPTPTPTPSVRQYTVQSGDTLINIAQAFLPPGGDVFSFAQQIADRNNINFNNPSLQPGQVLIIP
ncbi:MAG TPA: LysM peptidoglycan-binding domain-containing protein [Dehalococcoidia bacterium]|nr:LysM peptidoglycan-binding domain-containing protein [Dehalococcoidia bacterium]